jgi:hypothetical protein
MTAVAVVLKPVHRGWAVALTDGRELARFTGPLARFHAERYLHVTAAPGTRRRVG